MVQDITRPLGIPIQHSSIPFQNSMQSQTTMQNMDFLKDRMADILKMADELQITDRLHASGCMTVTKRSGATPPTTAPRPQRRRQQITDRLRDHIADFDDFWRPIRSYFYWEKHCFDIPDLLLLRSLFDTLDGIDQLAEKFHDLTEDIEHTAQCHARTGRAVAPA